MFSASSSPDSVFSENCVVVSKKGMWFDVPCKETSLDDKKFLPLCQRSPGKRYLMKKYCALIFIYQNSNTKVPRLVFIFLLYRMEKL